MPLSEFGLIDRYFRKTGAMRADVHLGVGDDAALLQSPPGSELVAAMERISSSPGLRTELGEKGYSSFVRWWCREAHLQLYVDYLNRIAFSKFDRIPWESSVIGHDA